MKLRTIVAVFALGTSGTALAQGPAAPVVAPDANAATVTNYVVPGQVKRASGKDQGWSYNLTLAANMNVSSNRDVVGQLEGNSLLLGASVLSGIAFVKDRHEWLNTGSLTEAFSKTPALNLFVKSNDALELQSLYNFFLLDWTGPFARIGAQTPLLRTERVTPGVVTYTNADDPTDVRTRSRLRLSDSFQPFTLTESVGWFIQPLRSEPLNLYARAGLGGRHTFAEGALSVKGDLTASTATFQVLDDVHQAGAELFAGVDGKQLGGKLVYGAGVTALVPFLNNDNTDRGFGKLTRVGFAAAVGMGVFSWMSINYQLKVLRDIQLLDAVQVQNALLLSFQYAVVSPAQQPAKPSLAPEVEAQIKTLEQRAAAAEERARIAEQRSQAASVPVPAPAEPAVPPAPAVESPQGLEQ